MESRSKSNGFWIVTICKNLTLGPFILSACLDMQSAGEGDEMGTAAL
jgi:hypothetical protein